MLSHSTHKPKIPDTGRQTDSRQRIKCKKRTERQRDKETDRETDRPTGQAQHSMTTRVLHHKRAVDHLEQGNADTTSTFLRLAHFTLCHDYLGSTPQWSPAIT
eukprot:gnl/TRDRNA2_/TRDRNA2_175474_c4_seq2.p1 gnl/TRDRNA2_/TRDRNA2_175474_c4~~gnl/TRDRNA2_/TRDRNA2_175474_c4_seq2.p1  ORF type:complete len:103 (+),score=3.03 gnl/TRDRNA2_/TRDRNA2_175474_c4_seq2:85-393(+)